MTKCSVFHFELQVTYEKVCRNEKEIFTFKKRENVLKQASESIFTCPGVQLPPNFNSPAYLAQVNIVKKTFVIR